MDSSGELAKLGDRLLDFVLCAREDCGCGRVGAGSFEAQRNRECHEPLLRAVVQVALHAAALRIGCSDDSAPRCSNLTELRPHLCREALVLEHERRCRTNRFHQARIVEQCRIVNECGNFFAAYLHRRDGAVGSP